MSFALAETITGENQISWLLRKEMLLRMNNKSDA